MATIHKCDACGGDTNTQDMTTFKNIREKLVRSEAEIKKTPWVIDSISYDPHIAFDLCSRCYDKFVKAGYKAVGLTLKKVRQHYDSN